MNDWYSSQTELSGNCAGSRIRCGCKFIGWRWPTLVEISNPGLGYISPPQIFIDNFGTNGSGLNINITQDLIDPATGELTGLNIVSPGSGYTSPPKIRIEVGS